jgi:hypothetical protein
VIVGHVLSPENAPDVTLGGLAGEYKLGCRRNRRVAPVQSVLFDQDPQLAKRLQQIVVGLWIEVPVPAWIAPGPILLLYPEDLVCIRDLPEFLHRSGFFRQKVASRKVAEGPAPQGQKSR